MVDATLQDRTRGEQSATPFCYDHTMPPQQAFSWRWTFASMGIFMGAELLLGMLVGELVVGRYVSISLRFMVQGLLHVASFFVGGLIVGVVSPGVRIEEPAVGAALSVGVTLALTVFSPYTFMQLETGKLIVGGIIAFVVALAGAKLGERLTGNKV